jgi:hypothetical protein
MPDDTVGVRRMTAWVPVTRETLVDAPMLSAVIEYRMSEALDGPQPLTLRERLTGLRHYTARNGYVLALRVGWRHRLYWWTHPIENWRRLHPKYEDDDA